MLLSDKASFSWFSQGEGLFTQFDLATPKTPRTSPAKALSNNFELIFFSMFFSRVYDRRA